MDAATLPAAPYFDTQALRVELTALYRAHGESPGATRPALLDRLQEETGIKLIWLPWKRPGRRS